MGIVDVDDAVNHGYSVTIAFSNAGACPKGATSRRPGMDAGGTVCIYIFKLQPPKSWAKQLSTKTLEAIILPR